MKSIISSFAGIFVLFRSTGFNSPHLKEIGKHSANIIELMMQKGLDERRKMEGKGAKFVDFYYSQFISDPVAAVSELYSELDLEFTEKVRETLTEYCQESKKARKAAQKPIRLTLSELGLEENELDSRFASYYAQFPKVIH